MGRSGRNYTAFTASYTNRNYSSGALLESKIYPEVRRNKALQDAFTNQP